MPRVGLHMIVKDEAHVIERCLRSVRPAIDWWVVCDTGSTDGTQDLVRELMGDLPGVLLERPWVSFGHNRQEALQAARELPAARADDYVLWIDADDELVDAPSAWPALTEDGYFLGVEYDQNRFDRITVVRLDRPWQWQGVLHEHLDLPGATLGRLDAPRIRQRHDGARSRDPETYRRDAAVLERELERVPGNPRTQFYLAQSWRDAGEPERALAAYRLRAANTAGWDQERFYAQFQVGRCLEQLGRPQVEITEAHLEAYALVPRAEPLLDLARLERARDRYEVALVYARAALALPTPPSEWLFVDTSAYGWRALDEFAVNCYWTGRYAEGEDAAQRALRLCPDEPRLAENVEWFRRARGLSPAR